jgi:hypothetical protein
MKMLSLAVTVVAVSFFAACGPSESVTCDDCLSQQAQALPEDGCYPYCETETDDDSDGVSNDYDLCPATMESHNGLRDNDGCPDTTLEGNWGGTASLILPFAPPFERSATVVIGSNDYVRLYGMCQDPSAAIATTGGTTILHGYGTLTCPPAQVGECPSVSVTLSSLYVALRDDGSLSISATAAYSGCGRDETGTALFSGWRQ